MLSPVLDVFRVRQVFNLLARGREMATSLGDDALLVNDLRRALLPLPSDSWPDPDRSPFPPAQDHPLPALADKRVGLIATGGSGALASVVGVGRAFEESGLRPAVLSLCSGSALFGFPLAAGRSADDVARFVSGLRPSDYVDPDWRRVLSSVPSGLRGFGGVLRGERLEESYRRFLGDITLGELPIPAYAPIWNIERNELEYMGPATRPDLPVARAVRHAVALPLFIEPVPLDGSSWCDGGLVDIFPVHPVLDLEPPCDVVLTVNGFYPPGFAGEDATGWQDRRLSILHIASQVRTSQQVALARENLDRLRGEVDRVTEIAPVPYTEVQGTGFYQQFLDTRSWGRYMAAGRADALEALGALAAAEA